MVSFSLSAFLCTHQMRSFPNKSPSRNECFLSHNSWKSLMLHVSLHSKVFNIGIFGSYLIYTTCTPFHDLTHTTLATTTVLHFACELTITATLVSLLPLHTRDLLCNPRYAGSVYAGSRGKRRFRWIEDLSE